MANYCENPSSMKPCILYVHFKSSTIYQIQKVQILKPKNLKLNKPVNKPITRIHDDGSGTLEIYYEYNVVLVTDNTILTSKVLELPLSENNMYDSSKDNFRQVHVKIKYKVNDTDSEEDETVENGNAKEQGDGELFILLNKQLEIYKNITERQLKILELYFQNKNS